MRGCRMSRAAAREHPVQPQAIDAREFSVRQRHRTSAARKANDLGAGNPGTNAIDNFLRRLNDHQRSNCSGGSTPARIENLHCHFGAGPELPDQISNRATNQPINQPSEVLRIAIGEQTRRRLIEVVASPATI